MRLSFPSSSITPENYPRAHFVQMKSMPLQNLDDSAQPPCPGFGSLFITLPVLQHLRYPWRICQLIDLLKVLFRDLERLGCHVRDILANQLARIDAGLIDLLEQERTERLDA